MRRLVLGMVAVGLLLGLASPAQAAPLPAQNYAPVDIVHQEQVTVGPYAMTVGFSQWPLRARQSLDFTFEPAGGIGQYRATLVATDPAGETDRLRRPYGVEVMPRHPRQPTVWGLDVLALDQPGEWIFRIGLDGPQGPATGELRLTVLEQPGPPLALSFAASMIPLVLIIGLLAFAARRGGRTPSSRA